MQQALLKVMEGTIASVPPHGGRKHPQQEFLNVDTTNILFICGGAFMGLEKIIEQRIIKSAIGFSAEIIDSKSEKRQQILRMVEIEDLIKFGMIPEFMGRIPVIAALDTLTADDLVHIMTEPEDSIEKEYKAIFGLDRVELEFTSEARVAIAKLSIAKKTGARGLRNIIEHILLDIQFNLPELAQEGLSKVIITEQSVEDHSTVKIYKNLEIVA